MNQDVFEYYWNQGLTDKEIAQKMNVSEGIIKTFRTSGKNAGKI